jgi:signal transduction histidine kinase
LTQAGINLFHLFVAVVMSRRENQAASDGSQGRDAMTMEGKSGPDSNLRAAINLNEVLLSLVHARVHASGASAVLFSMDLAPNLPDILVNPRQIETVLEILFDKAVDSVRGRAAGGGEIHIRTDRQRDRIHLTITDNGRGLHWRDMDGLFGDKSREVALTICARLVRDNGGDLYAFSQYGMGSIFTIDVAAEPPLRTQTSEHACVAEPVLSRGQ